MKNLAHLLPVLDAPGFARVETSPPPLQLVSSNEFVMPSPQSFVETLDEVSAEDAPDRFQEGYDTGYALGLAQGRAQAMAEHAGQDVAMEAFVAKARAEWTAEQSQRLADGIGKAIRIIEDEIAGCVEKALVQILSEKMRARALDDFSARVREMCQLGEAGLVTIHAPPDLAEALASRLTGCGLIEFEASESAQVWVRSGGTLIEAKLAPWFAGLAETE